MLRGFDRSQLSLMATRRTVERSLGQPYSRSEDLADHPDAPHVAFVGCDSRTEARVRRRPPSLCRRRRRRGAIVAGGGEMAIAIAGALAAGGAGGAVGAVLARILDGYHARRLQEQLERGGILLWVRTTDAEREETACTILQKSGASGVHIHDIPARQMRRDGGVSEALAWINKPLHDWFRPPAAAERAADEVKPLVS